MNCDSRIIFFYSLASTTAKASVQLAYNAVTQSILSGNQSQQPSTADEENYDMPAAKQPHLEKSSQLWDCMDEIVQFMSTTSEQQEAAKGTDSTQYLHALVNMDDLLLWWRQNVERFPILAAVTHAYTGVTSTSIPFERLFSTAKEILDDHCSLLLPDNAALLVFLT